MKLIERLARQWPTAARDAAGVAGAGFIALGVGQIYAPAGLIVLGALLLVAAFLSAKAAA